MINITIKDLGFMICTNIVITYFLTVSVMIYTKKLRELNAGDEVKLYRLHTILLATYKLTILICTPIILIFGCIYYISTGVNFMKIPGKFRVFVALSIFNTISFIIGFPILGIVSWFDLVIGLKPKHYVINPDSTHY